VTDVEAAGPVETTRTFVDAVVWGEHHVVWELLGDEGRETVLRVAVNQGMEEALAARLREGTATTAELNEFLVELVGGLRADLQGADTDTLEYELDSSETEPGRARVQLTAPMPPELGGGLPACSAELTHDAGRWRVERLIPRRSVTG
jgi:hypothetical protein